MRYLIILLLLLCGCKKIEINVTEIFKANNKCYEFGALVKRSAYHNIETGASAYTKIYYEVECE